MRTEAPQPGASARTPRKQRGHWLSLPNWARVSPPAERRSVRLDPAPRRVLVICLRRLGDVLLSTALLHSLRLAWPGARIDFLVNAAAAPALEGNPDIDELVVQPERPGFLQQLRLAIRLFRRYDLALCTLYNDRLYYYALLASGLRVGVVPPETDSGARWKRWLCTAWCRLAPQHLHTLEQYLALADCLELPRHAVVVPPQPSDAGALERILGAGWRQRSYAVLHPSPMYRYKAWTVEGWRALASHLLQRGLDVCLSGGSRAHERAYTQEVIAGLPEAERVRVIDVAGQLSFAQLTPLIGHARVFVGPDTSVTHVAAATGRPTVALFGPSSTVTWGPWPQGVAVQGGSPWQMKAALQRAGNVWLLQGEGDCVPCLQEGCERHQDSRADCLDHLSIDRVVAAVDEALGRRARTIAIRGVAAVL